MRRRPHLGTVALVAALAFGAAGCGADSPKPGPVAESSATQSASQESASDFTRNFIKTLNTGSTDLDTTAWRKMFNDQCVYCERVADQLDSIKANGGSFTADPWVIKSIKVEKSTQGGLVSTARVRIPPQRVRYTKNGRVERTSGQADVFQQLRLVDSQNGLVAIDFGPVAS